MRQRARIGSNDCVGALPERGGGIRYVRRNGAHSVNLSYMDNFQPLTEEEKELTRKVAGIINAQIAIPCTGCSYCTESCLKKIAIPQYFSMYNEDMRENLAQKVWTATFAQYAVLTEKFGKASECIACDQCEVVCPQHLPIIERLKEVSGHFDQ